MELNKIYNADCFDVVEGMARLPENSVDMILCDLPYGTTANKWDVILPFDKLWEQYHRVCKDDGAVVLTAQNPFSAILLNSNIKNYRYEWIWNKNNGAGFALVKYRPFQICEHVLVFSKKTHNYYPIMKKGLMRNKKMYSRSNNYGNKMQSIDNYNDNYYPKNILEYSANSKQSEKVHPTQKPVKLFEYLIKTYTKENETILDNCMGSGTTAIAAMRTNRNYIGWEQDPGYYKIIQDRIEQEKQSTSLLDYCNTQPVILEQDLLQ